MSKRLLFAILLTLVPSLQAQTVLTQFDGDACTGGSLCYRDHPDPSLAANGYQYVEVTGKGVNVYDYSGTLLKSTAMGSFITNAGLRAGQIHDPRVIYDSFINRFIVVCSCMTDMIIVSQSSDGTGVFKGVALTSSIGDLTMFPGFDINQVCISEYDSVHGSAQYICLPNSDVAWTGSDNVSLGHEGLFTGQPFESRPTIDLSTTKAPTAPLYFVARDGPPQNGSNVSFNLLLTSVSWSGKTASVSGVTTMPSGFLYNTPINPSQPSSPPPSVNGAESHLGKGTERHLVKATESHRFFSAMMHGAHLYAAMPSGPCRSGCGKQGADSHNLFFWFDINTANSTIAQSAKVSDSSIDFIFPSLALDSNGNMGIVATGVSATQFASLYGFYHLASDSAGVIHGPNLMTPGTASYNCNSSSPVGWGTYSSTVPDMGDSGKLVFVGQYANSSTNCSWATRIIQFRLPPAPIPATGPTHTGVRR